MPGRLRRTGRTPALPALLSKLWKDHRLEHQALEKHYKALEHDKPDQGQTMAELAALAPLQKKSPASRQTVASGCLFSYPGSRAHTGADRRGSQLGSKIRICLRHGAWLNEHLMQLEAQT